VRQDSAREALLEVLASAWAAHPELRLCQLIVNASGRNDPFYVEDDDLALDLIHYGSDE
jgi:uncharacterized protein YihD (DUF1040 family)